LAYTQIYIQWKDNGKRVTRILRLKKGNHQIVYETLQIEKSYDKLVVLVRSF
jgi:hypothetical protein